MKLYKRYVSVIYLNDINGNITPKAILWESNGERIYTIDRILDRKRSSSVVGGCGILYECMIQGEKRNLFFEKDRWFIESHKP